MSCPESQPEPTSLIAQRFGELADFLKSLLLPLTPPPFALEDLPDTRACVLERADGTGAVCRVVFNRLARLPAEEWDSAWHEAYEKGWYQEELIRFSESLIRDERLYYSHESFRQRLEVTVAALDGLGIRHLRGAEAADLGSGSGALSALLAVRGAHVTAIDGSAAIQKLAQTQVARRVKSAARRIDFRVELLSELSSLRREALDWIFLQSTLYLMPPWLRRLILAKAYEKLKPEGQIIVLEMSNQVERSGWRSEPHDTWSGLPDARISEREAVHLPADEVPAVVGIFIAKPAP